MNNLHIIAQSGPSETTEPVKITSDQPGSPIEPRPPGAENQSTYQSGTKQPAPNGGPETAAAKKAPGPQWLNLLFIVAMFLLIYLVLFRGPQKKQQQQKHMIKSLKKNDKVRTIGGIIGTIVDIQDDEVTLKVDESNNTKIKIAPGAISKNLSED
jgi:preprotein translocase subunit YajC